MAKKEKFYNPELETTELYTEVWKPELITVKDVTDLLVINHYWQDSDGELWGDFNDPMENIRRGFAAYRERKGYMKPNEIKKLRNKLGMTVREFADYIGIGSSTLTQIENNKRLQVKYQENLFRSIKIQYEDGKNFLQDKNEDYERLLMDSLKGSPYLTDEKSYNTEAIYRNGQAFKKLKDLGDAA